MTRCRSKKKDEVTSRAELKKEIGVLQGVSIIVGVIVGSGIFVSPIGVLKNTQSVGLSFVMWAMTGVFSIIGALVYCELGVTIPKSGGEYIYILEAFGGMLAFCCLWITFLAVGATSSAANLYVFAQYLLKPFFAYCDIPNSAQICLGLFAFFTLVFINSYNVKWATKVAVIFTGCKIIALLMIVFIGFYYLAIGRTSSFENAFENSNYSPGSLSLAFYNGFWAFAGWNYLNFLTAEMKNPARNLPLAIILSLTIVMVVYMLVNVAYLAVLSPQEMLGIGNTAIAVGFAERTIGKFSWIMSICVAASVFGSVNGEILSMSRLAYAGAQEKHLPVLLGMISNRYLTPMPSIIALAILVVLLLLAFDVFYLIELTGFAFTVIFAMATCALLYIRKKHPNMNQTSFKLPVIIPVLFLIVDVFIAALAMYQQPKESILGLALMFVGIPIYLIGVAWKTKPKSFVKLIENATIYSQKLLLVIEPESTPSNTEICEEETRMENNHVK